MESVEIREVIENEQVKKKREKMSDEKMRKTGKQRKYISFAHTRVLSNFHDDDMTLDQFREHLINQFGTTKTGTPISKAYVHTLLSYGHYPKHWGGNKLYITMVRDSKTIAVRVLEEKHDFNANSGRVTEGQKKRG